ncbi:MAG: tetraacyldisaccharide 4'-kinase [Gemmatimonadota bacterium]
MTTPALDAFVRRWWNHDFGAAGRLLDAALAPAEGLYRGAIAARNAAYARGMLRAERAGVPVISVGNIATGGTGKTPFSNWLARRLAARGESPALLHGGYGSDEPELHRRWSPDIPVVVDRDRVRGAWQACQQGATVLILDDGFQHRRLHRDLDLLLLSAERWHDAARLLPRGPWREPRAALGRADLIVCTRKTAPAGAATRAAAEMSAASSRPVVRAHLHAGAWLHAGAPAEAPEGPVLLVAALAEPAIFAENARAAGADVADTMFFPDHHVYLDADADRIRQRASGRVVATTEKDWTKLDALLDTQRVWLLAQTVEIEDGAAALDEALTRVLS